MVFSHRQLACIVSVSVGAFKAFFAFSPHQFSNDLIQYNKHYHGKVRTAAQDKHINGASLVFSHRQLACVVSVS